ncbi:DUF397 domain-containing protein [Streptomyces sp. NBUA17]|uniref:DUF397 domain-containing protein n=1 Tax=Streptomyces sp. NBUA17 TaxID=3062275 RepID=UPI0037D9AA62
METEAGTAAVHIRGSKAAAGPVLAVPRAAWAGFVELAAASEQRGWHSYRRARPAGHPRAAGHVPSVGNRPSLTACA